MLSACRRGAWKYKSPRNAEIRLDSGLRGQGIREIPIIDGEEHIRDGVIHPYTEGGALGNRVK